MLEYLSDLEVKELFRKFPDLLNRKNGDGENVLMNSIRRKRFDLAKWLIINKIDVNVVDSSKETPLALACFSDCTPTSVIHKLYLESTEKVVTESDVIRNCMYSGRSDLIEFFLKKNLLPIRESEEDPFSIQVYKYEHLSDEKKLSVIKVFWDYGIPPYESETESDENLLHLMIKNHSHFLLENLFPYFDQEYMVKNKISNYALKHKNLKAIELLVKENIEITLDNKDRKLLLIESCIEGNYTIFNYLIAQGLDINTKSTQNNSLIMHAISNIEKEQDVNFVKHLLGHKPSLTLKNDYQEDVFDLAIQRNVYHVFEEYIDSMSNEELFLYKTKRLYDLMENSD